MAFRRSRLSTEVGAGGAGCPPLPLSPPLPPLFAGPLRRGCGLRCSFVSLEFFSPFFVRRRQIYVCVYTVYLKDIYYFIKGLFCISVVFIVLFCKYGIVLEAFAVCPRGAGRLPRPKMGFPWPNEGRAVAPF